MRGSHGAMSFQCRAPSLSGLRMVHCAHWANVTSLCHYHRIPSFCICPDLWVRKLFAVLRVPQTDACASSSVSQGTSTFSICNHPLKYGPCFSLGTKEEETARTKTTLHPRLLCLYGSDADDNDDDQKWLHSFKLPPGLILTAGQDSVPKVNGDKEVS